VLDLDSDVQAGHGERSTAEMGIILAASIAALLLDARRAVGIMACGRSRRTVLPARGRAHLWTLLHVLAQVQITESRPLARVLEEAARVLPAGATALVISPSADPAWIPGVARLHDRGVDVAAVLLDAASFAAESIDLTVPLDEDGRALMPRSLLSQADVMAALLTGARAEAKIVRSDTPLILRPPTGQVRRWEFKVLGTGRAVAVTKPWERNEQ
jgi:uncharacterized protein (DUF58 family)